MATTIACHGCRTLLVTMKNEEDDEGLLAVLALALTRTGEGVLAFLNASGHV